jgi:hypothetical protein
MRRRIITILASILGGLALFVLARHGALQRLAYAQSSAQQAFSVRIAAVAIGDGGVEHLHEERLLTMTSDGVRLESEPIPGRSPDERLVSVIRTDGSVLMVAEPLRILSRRPAPRDTLAMARARSHQEKPASNNCVNEANGDVFLRMDRLLGKLDATVVRRRPLPNGLRLEEWRVPSAQCLALQTEVFQETGGNWKLVKVNRVVSYDPISLTGEEVETRYRDFETVMPSEMHRRLQVLTGGKVHVPKEVLDKLDRGPK